MAKGAGKVFVHFSGWTSAHGVPHIGASSNKWLKVFWAVILLFSLCMFFYQLSQLITKYLDYDVTVQTELKFDKIKFPTVTVCNINPYIWEGIQSQKNTNEHFTAIYDALDKYAQRQTTTDSEDAQMQGEAEQTVVYAAAQLTDDEKKLITYTRNFTGLAKDLKTHKGLILRCMYDQEACAGELDFEEYIDETYGRCYQYNFNGLKMSDRAGPDSGLRLELIVNQEMYMPTTDSVGARIAVHNEDTPPYIDAFGYNAAAGFTTSFGVKFVEMQRQPYPYGNCTMTEKLAGGYSEDKYTVEGCFHACFQDEIIARCDCAAPKFKDPAGVTVDKCKKEDADCVESILNGTHPDVGDLIPKCTCPQPCRESSYAVTVSTAGYPALSFHPPECRKANLDLPIWEAATYQAKEEECVQWFRDNAMVIEVYYERMNYQLLKESEAYTLVNLISDLGGQMGLWLGVSVITIIEVVSLFIMCCMVTCGKKEVTEKDEDEDCPFDGEPKEE